MREFAKNIDANDYRDGVNNNVAIGAVQRAHKIILEPSVGVTVD